MSQGTIQFDLNDLVGCFFPYRQRGVEIGFLEFQINECDLLFTPVYKYEKVMWKEMMEAAQQTGILPDGVIKIKDYMDFIYMFEDCDENIRIACKMYDEKTPKEYRMFFGIDPFSFIKERNHG